MPSIQLRRLPEQKRAQRIADQCGITEAYSDPCFQSPTRFFVASPEHPMMGKWAQRSTLKYHRYDAPLYPHKGTSSLAPTKRNVRLQSCCYLVNERGRIVSGLEASRRSGRKPLAYQQSKTHRRAPPARAKPAATRIEKRSTSPGPQRDGCAECPPETPSFSEPPIYTPILGRVISLHKQTVHDVVIPSLPSELWGSFPSSRVSAVVGAKQISPAAPSVSRTSPQADILDANVSLSTSLTGEGIPVDQIIESLCRAGGVKKEDAARISSTSHVLLPPDIRYRVRLEGTSLTRKNDGVSGVGTHSNQTVGEEGSSTSCCTLDDDDHSAGKEELERKGASQTRGTEALAPTGAAIVGSYLMGDICTKRGPDDNGTATPKSCLSPVELLTGTAAGGLFPVSKTSTATGIIHHQPRLRFCPTEETNPERASIEYATYYSNFWCINNQLAAPFWRRVIETKSKQILVFDLGDSTGRLHAYPFLGTRCAWRFGELLVRALDVAGVLFGAE